MRCGSRPWASEASRRSTLRQIVLRLIHASHKRFLPGPCEHRTALDEVVQMMGAMSGAIGALAALQQRHVTGRGQQVQSAPFENNVFLVAQHMMPFAVTGKPASPMPSRISACVWPR